MIFYIHGKTTAGVGNLGIRYLKMGDPIKRYCGFYIYANRILILQKYTWVKRNFREDMSKRIGYLQYTKFAKIIKAQHIYEYFGYCTKHCVNYKFIEKILAENY